MHLFHNRPLALACCVFAGCVALVSFVNRRIGVALLFLSVLLLLVFAVLCWRKRTRAWLLSLICVIAAVLALVTSFFSFHVRYPRYQEYVGKECVVEGTVLERARSTPYGTVLYVQVDSIDGNRERVDMMLEFEYASSLQVGERFRVTGTGRAFKNENGYDEKRSVLSDGVALALVCKEPADCEILEGESRSLRVFFSEMNARAAFRLENAVGGRAGKLCAALLLGNRDALNDDEALAFERAGVSHLLALSGMHISILIMIAEWILRKCCCPRRGRALTVSVLAILYLFLTGASLSTARAVCMLCVLTVAVCLQESYDSFTGLCIALAFILLVMPYAVWDTGMWMSFIAAGSIIVFSPLMSEASRRFAKRFSLPRMLHRALFGVLGALFVGTVANLALAYLQANVFGSVSALSVPATMLLSIPLSLTLIFSIAALILPPLGFAARASADWMLNQTARMSDVEDILLPMNDLLTQSVLLLLTVALVLLAVLKLRRALWCVLPLSLALAAVISSVSVTHVAHRELDTEWLDGGKGEILLLTQAGDAVAVTYAAEVAGGAYVIADALEESRCTEINDLVITHYYHQSTYFLATLAGEVKIRNLRLPTPANEVEEGIAMRLCEEADKRGIEVYFHLSGLALYSAVIEKNP
ncbi:MAG: ComEC/Rec2 family competence protein [Clostridia bacterium]|nr:ComEC/Rec2 family competence protein [Clostridia bacterium]